jgi:hypothetical protein
VDDVAMQSQTESVEEWMWSQRERTSCSLVHNCSQLKRLTPLFPKSMALALILPYTARLLESRSFSFSLTSTWVSMALGITKYVISRLRLSPSEMVNTYSSTSSSTSTPHPTPLSREDPYKTHHRCMSKFSRTSGRKPLESEGPIGTKSTIPSCM